jgi:hypothetical protein
MNYCPLFSSKSSGSLGSPAVLQELQLVHLFRWKQPLCFSTSLGIFETSYLSRTGRIFWNLEACLADGDDETMTSNRVQLKDFIARGAFGTVKREYVYNTCLRVFTKRFASQSMS